MGEPPAAADRLDHPAFSLRLMGSPGVTATAGVSVAGLGHGKPLAMLAYLAVRGEARRDELIELLWGGVPDSRARNAFRQSLHRLRSALGDELIPQDRESVKLLSGNNLTVDRSQFVRACDDGRWSEAAGIYTGDFLEAFALDESGFDEWADNERMRLRTRYETALRKATQQAMDGGNLPAAVGFAQNLSVVAPYDESAATLETTVLSAAGRQGEALASIRRFTARMRAEMELPVSPAVRELTVRLERSSRRPTPSSTDSAARPNATLPFQGRVEEIARLVGRANDLAAQRGATLLIDGEAGIGKTRLVEEFAERMSAMGDFLVARGRERPGGSALPYASVAEALRTLVGAPGVAGTSRHLLTEAARILPELRDLFDIAAPGPVEDEGGRLRFFEGVAAVVDSAAYEQPVCVVLDDLHHASPETLDLVAYLSSRLQGSPVMLLLLARLESAPAPTAARLLGLFGDSNEAPSGGAGTRLSLGGLSDDDIDALIRIFVERRGATLPTQLGRIVQLSAGRPLAALELTRRAIAGELPSELPLPLRDILWARLLTASPSERRVFFAASLIQRSASLRLLAAASHLPESATFDAALQLERLGLLAPSGTGFVAAHDVTHSFVLDSSGFAGRALLASWAADAIAEESDGADAELAHLYSLAGRADLAFQHARAAAFSAAAAGAAADAARLASAALTFAPDDRSRRDVETLLTALGGRDLKMLTRVAEQPYDESATGETLVADEPEPTEARPRSNDTGTALPTSEVTTPVVPTPERAKTTHRRIWWIGAAGLLLLAVAIVQRQSTRRSAVRVLTDSVVVSERGVRNGSGVHVVTGALDAGSVQLLTAASLRPAWVDSLLPPLVNPALSPDGRLISVERMTHGGTDLFVMGTERRDTTRLTLGGGDDIALGWSPDSRSLLVSRARVLEDGSYDSDLYAYGLRPMAVVPIDTAADRAVTEAAWSPDGSMIAWVARVGADRQQEIFVSRPDGTNRRNISANPADDSQISWSPDGTLLAFASNRGGSSHIYTYDLEARRLWTVTSGGGSESHPIFSIDGKFLAFESTRDGDAAVYVTLPLGGTAFRITPPGRQFSLAGWRGRAQRYIDHLRILAPSSARTGDTISVGAVATDQGGAPIAFSDVAWSVIDPEEMRIVDNGPTANPAQAAAVRLAMKREGRARLTAQIRGWRSDTVTIDVGGSITHDLTDSFSHGLSIADWRSLGVPRPVVQNAPHEVAKRALYPSADLEWESGVLSRLTFDLRQPLSLSARLYAPFGGHPIPAATLDLSLVPAVAEASVDSIAPQFTPLISVVWNGESDRITYAVGRESFSEVSSRLGAASSHVATVSIDSSGAVSFGMDGSVRWRSALRFVGDAADLRARLWLGGRATGTWGAYSDVTVTPGVPARR
jgi:DNA-binding SARP family transcriptional activator/WD40 repeat protein